MMSFPQKMPQQTRPMRAITMIRRIIEIVRRTLLVFFFSLVDSFLLDFFSALDFFLESLSKV